MVLVLVFIALMLCLYGVAYRHVASAVRIESTRALQARRDEGSLHALALGLARLETGVPPSSPYVGGVTLDTSTGQRSFTLTFTLEGGDTWTVGVAPTGPVEDPDPLPESFQ
jgi:hypothetical protein